MKFDKYEKLGDYHWQTWKNNPTAPYCIHANICATAIKERPILDVGCGDGLITHLFGAGAIGVDELELPVQMAIKHGVMAIQLNALDIPKVFKGLPAIFFGDVIEHLENPAEVLKQLRAALKTDGILHISTPPKKASGQLQSPYHIREYTGDELVQLVQPAGFKLRYPGVIVRNDLVQMYATFTAI